MSAGHGHRRLSRAHPEELKKLMAEPTAAAMLAKPPRLITTFTISDTGGYPVMGDWRYIDVDFVNAVKAGQVRVPGMTPAQILHAVFLHEWLERVLLDADNNIDSYLSAHEYSTLFEHSFVKSLGVGPKAYEDGIEKLIKFNENKNITHPPLDLDCAPMIDDPDANDKRVLKILQGLGVPDASKKSKETLQYGKSTGTDRCNSCVNWQGTRSAALSPCKIVSGAVRLDRLCSAFQPMEKEDGEKLDSQGNSEQRGSPPQLGGAGGQENPSGQDTGGNAFQQPQGPQAGQLS